MPIIDVRPGLQIYRRLFLLGFMVATLLSTSAGALAGNAFSVIVSIKPMHSLVAALMEGAQPPELLISGQQTPYEYELTPAGKKSLQDANLVIWVGPELEASLAGVMKNLPDSVQVVELLSSPQMKILPSRTDDTQRDPFFWMDDRNSIILVDALTRLLMAADPARAHIYRSNRRELQQKLGRIDREYEYGYRGLKAGLGVQYFDTLQYFEQAYALTVLDHVSGSPRQPVDAAAMLKVRQRIVDGEAACILVEAGMPTDHLALLTQGSAVNIGHLDTLGLGFKPGPELYIQMMDHNTDTIKRCLNADVSEAEQARISASAVAQQHLTPANIGGRFMLSDHNGNLFNERDLLGHYSLVYFGYTFCPDICPTSLQTQAAALDLLGERADKIRPYFVTVDPQRDTVEVMNGFVKYFDKRLTGLTGSPAMIERVAAQFKVRYEIVREEGMSQDLYLMDHSASLYLMGPDGHFITKFAHGISAQNLADELSAILR